MTWQRLVWALLTLPLVALADDSTTASLNRAVAFFEARLAHDPDDFNAANQLCDRLMRRHRWTGHLADLRRAGEVAEQSFKSAGPRFNPGGLAARGEVALAMHRFAEARDIAVELEPWMSDKPFPAQLLGDAQLELGNLKEAEAAYALMATRTDLDAGIEARLGRLAWMRGQIAEAREHFEGAVQWARALPEASPETAVWALVQWGELNFKTGNWEAAAAAYQEAQDLAPEQWSVLDHLAELRGAQGKDDEAVALYQRAAERSQRAEVWQALGDYQSFVRRPEQAAAAYERALAGYLASIAAGEVLYVHHLAGFYADSKEDPPEAVKWAQRDLELRPSAYAWDALAWAQYRHEDLEEAQRSAGSALAHGLADPHVLYHAAMIAISTGKIADGQALLKRSAAVNPHFNAFHAHR